MGVKGGGLEERRKSSPRRGLGPADPATRSIWGAAWSDTRPRRARGWRRRNTLARGVREGTRGLRCRPSVMGLASRVGAAEGRASPLSLRPSGVSSLSTHCTRWLQGRGVGAGGEAVGVRMEERGGRGERSETGDWGGSCDEVRGLDSRHSAIAEATSAAAMKTTCLTVILYAGVVVGGRLGEDEGESEFERRRWAKRGLGLGGPMSALPILQNTPSLFPPSAPAERNGLSPAPPPRPSGRGAGLVPEPVLVSPLAARARGTLFHYPLRLLSLRSPADAVSRAPPHHEGRFSSLAPCRALTPCTLSSHPHSPSLRAVATDGECTRQETSDIALVMFRSPLTLSLAARAPPPAPGVARCTLRCSSRCILSRAAGGAGGGGRRTGPNCATLSQ